MSGLKRTTACVRAHVAHEFSIDFLNYHCSFKVTKLREQFLGTTYLAEIKVMLAGSGFTKGEKTDETAEEVSLDDYVKGTKYLTTDNYVSVTKYTNVRF